MSGVLPTNLASLVGARGSNDPTGFQIAHFIAQELFGRGLRNFLSIGKDDPQNLLALPGRDRGALVFNVTKHARHVLAVNDIIFDAVTETRIVDGKQVNFIVGSQPNSNKFLNRIWEEKAVLLEDAEREARAEFIAENPGLTDEEIEARQGEIDSRAMAKQESNDQLGWFSIDAAANGTDCIEGMSA